MTLDMTSLNETKMAISATTIWMFGYFAILWLRMWRNRRSRRIRALLEASRRRLAALYAEQEEMHAVLTVLCTRRFFLSTLQRRSSWMMPRRADFSANTIQSRAIASECCPDSTYRSGASSPPPSKTFHVPPYCLHLKYGCAPTNRFEIQLRTRFSNRFWNRVKVIITGFRTG